MNLNIAARNFEQTDLDSLNVAVVGSDRRLTWQALRTEALALRELLGTNDAAVLWGHKQAGCISAIAGCICAETTYIPVDSQNVPLGRLAEILDISGVEVVIDPGDTLRHQSWEASAKPTIIWQDLSGVWQIFPGQNRGSAKAGPLISREIVYVMFTSGSTGKPKGVQISQEAVLAFTAWMRREFKFGRHEIYFNQAPLNFDLSCYEVMAVLSFGGTIVLRAQDMSGSATMSLVAEQRCSVWVSTPSFVLQFLREPDFAQIKLPALRQFVFCGETLPIATARALMSKFPDALVVNTYGPTEATVACTRVEIQPADLTLDSLPVGSPMNPGSVAIVSENGCLSYGPDCEPGQILLSGPNVSHGYLNDPDRNAEKFGVHKGQRSFFTGDYGYFRDGQLYFQGRKDGFVKLNGYRIELEEITSRLQGLPDVLDATTIPVQKGGAVRRVVAFVATASALDPMYFKEVLTKTLPVYMVPSEIYVRSQFPMNANGKIDKRRLMAEAGFTDFQ